MYLNEEKDLVEGEYELRYKEDENDNNDNEEDENK